MLTLKQLRLVINQTTGHMNMLTWWWCYMTLADLSSGDIKCLWWLTSVSHHNRSTQLSDPVEPVTPDKQSSGKESPEVWKHHAVVLQRFLGCIRPVETTVSYWPIRSDGCWFRFRLVSWTCLSMKLYKHSSASCHTESSAVTWSDSNAAVYVNSSSVKLLSHRAALTAPKDLLWEHSRMSSTTGREMWIKQWNGTWFPPGMLKIWKGSGSGCVLTLLSRIRSLSSVTDLMWQKPQSFVDCCGFKGNCINFVKWCLCMLNFSHFFLQIQHAYRCQQVDPFGVFRTDTDY